MSSKQDQCRHWILWVFCCLVLSGCSVIPKGTADLDVGIKERGIASWYGGGFNGQPTASGEIYDMEALTGAHRTLPLGTVLKVTNAENGRQVQVRINDRGPYVNGRIADLSYAAARRLGMIENGTSAVQLEVVGRESWPSTHDGWAMRIAAMLQISDSSAQAPRIVYRASQTITPPAQRRGRTPFLPPGDLIVSRRTNRLASTHAADQGEMPPADESL